MRLFYFALSLFFVSCSANKNVLQPQVIIAKTVSQGEFVQTELQAIKNELAQNPQYTLSQDELTILNNSNEFSAEELAQLNQLL